MTTIQRRRFARTVLAAGLALVMLAACAQPALEAPPAQSAAPTATALDTPTPASTAVLRSDPTAVPTIVLATATPQAAATTAPTLDAGRLLPACGEGLALISVAALPAATSRPGWVRYTQAAYDLAVDLPPDWGLAVGPHSLCLAPAAAPTVALTIGFRGPIEDAVIVRSGVAAGDIVNRGSVVILGQTVERDVLVYQGRDKAVLYNSAAEIDTAEIALTASLDDDDPDYNAGALPPALQATADQIVATLAALPASPGWQTYTSAAFNLTVQYPPSWHRDATSQALYAGRDGFFSISAAGSLGPTAQIACQVLVPNTQTRSQLDAPFGRQPELQTVQVDRQRGCLITPSADQRSTYPGTALLMMDYPPSLGSPRILQLWADPAHIRELAARLKFASR